MFDVSQYTFNISDINKYIHLQPSERKEKLELQKRLLRKWKQSRDKLHAFTLLITEQVSSYQLEKISSLVDFAFSMHPFYRELYKKCGYKRGDIVSWDDYNALPTITKKDIIDNYELFTQHLFPPISESYAPRTSGSSGLALTALFDSTAVDIDLMHCLRFSEQMLGGYRRPSEWFYQVYLACPPMTSLDGSYPTFTVSNDCPAEAIIEHLKLIKPAILSGIPSALGRIASQVSDPEEFGIRAVNTNSEPSTIQERANLSRAFSAPVFDEYSSVELCLIATQCFCGKYHIVEDNVRVDVINPDESGNGEIVATNLHNTYMPFIRYRQGDIIKIYDSESDCACGSKMRIIESFHGRSDQFLKSRTVGVIAPDMVMSLYDRTLLTKDAAVKEFKIEQIEASRVIVYLMPLDNTDTINAVSVASFKDGLAALFKDPNFALDIRIVEKIPASKSYKRRLIEYLVPE